MTMKNLELTSGKLLVTVTADDIIIRGIHELDGKNMMTSLKRWNHIIRCIEECFDTTNKYISYGTAISHGDISGIVDVDFEIDSNSNVPNCFWWFGDHLKLSLTRDDFNKLKEII